jgi:hypothetical protein
MEPIRIDYTPRLGALSVAIATLATAAAVYGVSYGLLFGLAPLSFVFGWTQIQGG